MYAFFMGMPGLPELLIIAVIAVIIILVIFYLITLRTALSRCSIESRTLSPGLVWLQFIPLFHLIWSFVLVINISKSLGNEFQKRGIVESPHPGLGAGLAMAICSVLSFISCSVRSIIIVIILAKFVFWIMYWVKIAGYSSKIAEE